MMLSRASHPPSYVAFPFCLISLVAAIANFSASLSLHQVFCCLEIFPLSSLRLAVPNPPLRELPYPTVVFVVTETLIESLPLSGALPTRPLSTSGLLLKTLSGRLPSAGEHEFSHAFFYSPWLLDLVLCRLTLRRRPPSLLLFFLRGGSTTTLRSFFTN